MNPFSFLLSILIATTIHEMGHILAAYWQRATPMRVGIGYGPVIAQWQWQGNTITLSILPIAVHVAIPGRRYNDGTYRRTLGQEMTIASAGVLTMFPLAAIAIFLSDPTLFFVTTALNLLNMLPIPGTDGWYMLLLIAARIGYAWPPRQETLITRVGARVTSIACACTVIIYLAIQYL